MFFVVDEMLKSDDQWGIDAYLTSGPCLCKISTFDYAHKRSHGYPTLRSIFEQTMMAQCCIPSHNVNDDLVAKKIMVIYIPRAGTDTPFGPDILHT